MFFERETKVRLNMVNMFSAAKFHPVGLYATMEKEEVSFSVETINEIYELPHKEVEECPDHQLINTPT